MTGADRDQELMEIFYNEANILLEEMKRDLALLSTDQSAVSLAEEKVAIFQRLRRCAHTIKGSSGIVGLIGIQDIARAVEIIFKVAKDEDTIINSHSIAVISEGLDVCRNILEGQHVGSQDDLLGRLNSITNR